MYIVIIVALPQSCSFQKHIVILENNFFVLFYNVTLKILPENHLLKQLFLLLLPYNVIYKILRRFAKIICNIFVRFTIRFSPIISQNFHSDDE